MWLSEYVFLARNWAIDETTLKVKFTAANVLCILNPKPSHNLVLGPYTLISHHGNCSFFSLTDWFYVHTDQTDRVGTVMISCCREALKGSRVFLGQCGWLSLWRAHDSQRLSLQLHKNMQCLLECRSPNMSSSLGPRQNSCIPLLNYSTYYASDMDSLHFIVSNGLTNYNQKNLTALSVCFLTCRDLCQQCKICVVLCLLCMIWQLQSPRKHQIQPFSEYSSASHQW